MPILTTMLLTLGWTTGCHAASADRRTECLGYYTIRLPGEFEYAVQRPPYQLAAPPHPAKPWQPDFSKDDLGIWGTEFLVDSGGVVGNEDRNLRIEISAEATLLDLDALVQGQNAQSRKEKDDLLDHAQRIEKRGGDKAISKMYLKEAADIRFFQPYSGGKVYALGSDSAVGLYAYIGGRIVSAGRKLDGTTQQTIDTFFKNYHTRAPFEVPTQPGVCLPYAFMTGEIRPSVVGASLRLTDQPDIVVYLRDEWPTTYRYGKSPEDYVLWQLQLGAFPGATVATPMDKNAPTLFEKIMVDGREGIGFFAVVTRARRLVSPNNNEANDDKDWAYYAYIPGDKAAPSGMSSDLIFKVQRYGRFAKQPMTQQEFRDLVKEIAASIKRRPGAWRAH